MDAQPQCWWPGPWFNIKISSYQYRKSHCGDKTVIRLSYLDNGISYTGKMTSLYWISPPGLLYQQGMWKKKKTLHWCPGSMHWQGISSHDIDLVLLEYSVPRTWGINPLHAKLFWGNINIYLHFMSFLHIDLTQVLKTLPRVREEPTYSETCL